MLTFPWPGPITPYNHKLWHRRYFFNREVPYWLQSSVTGSACRGLLILQKNSMLTDTKIFRSRMGAFRCIDTRYRSRVRNCIRWRSFYSMLRSDCVIAQLVRQTRLENRTSCNSFSPDLHVSGTFERHVTLYDWLVYRAIGKLRTGESHRVAGPLRNRINSTCIGWPICCSFRCSIENVFMCTA